MANDLVERAAKAYDDSACNTCREAACHGFTCLHGFRAAIAIVVEEAAKVVESQGPATQDMTSTYICEALDAAATAIRAMNGDAS